MDKFTPLVKKGVTTFINELVNEKIETALNTPEKIDLSLAETPKSDMQAYLIIRDSEDKDQRYEINVLKDVLIERLKAIL